MTSDSLHSVTKGSTQPEKVFVGGREELREGKSQRQRRMDAKWRAKNLYGRRLKVHTLSLRSSTILRSGPVLLGRRPLVAGPGWRKGGWVMWSWAGDEGVESPRTVVWGRKREAMMTPWLRKRLIAGERRLLGAGL